MLLYASRDDCEGATLYITREPCEGCRKRIRGSGVVLVVWRTAEGYVICPIERL